MHGWERASGTGNDDPHSGPADMVAVSPLPQEHGIGPGIVVSDPERKVGLGGASRGSAELYGYLF